MPDRTAISIPWRSQLLRAETAPRDGSYFHAIEKGRVTPNKFRWDPEMGCFLSTDFDCVNELACWWPADTKIGLEVRQRHSS